MRAEAFGKVLQGVARLCGLDPARLGTELAESLAGWIEQRVTQAWEAFPWPELCPVEERFYAAAHDSEATYADGDVVRVTADGATGYYTLLQAGSQATTPGTDETVWETTAPARFIDLDQGEVFGVEGITPMGEVLGVWRDDPRKVRGPHSVGYTLSEDRICLDPHAPAAVFVQFRRRPPAFTSVAWDANATYAPGDAVFYNNECYVAGNVTPGAYLTVTGNGALDNLTLAGRYDQAAFTVNGFRVYLKADTNLGFAFIGDGWATVTATTELDVQAFSLRAGFFQNTTLTDNPNSAVTAYVAQAGSDEAFAAGTIAVVRTAASTNPAADPNWTVVRVPHVLANFARRAARADFLADDGQDDKAFAQERRAADWLDEQFINVTVTQGQTARYSAHR